MESQSLNNSIVSKICQVYTPDEIEWCRYGQLHEQRQIELDLSKVNEILLQNEIEIPELVQLLKGSAAEGFELVDGKIGFGQRGCASIKQILFFLPYWEIFKDIKAQPLAA